MDEMTVSGTTADRFQILRARMLRTVEMLESRELTRSQYHNERELAGLARVLGNEVLCLTCDQALAKAIEVEADSTLSNMEAKDASRNYVRLATALELRQTYTARAF